MPYPAAAIANSFLDLARSDGRQLTPMQIQKLVYFAHGWHLASVDEELSEEGAQAWRWGPVFPTLYHAVKQWGGGPVDSDVTATSFVIRNGQHHIARSVRRVANDKDTQAFLSTIWGVYRGMTGPELSRLSHDIDGPWYRVWSESEGAMGAVIPNDLIREYFQEKLEIAK